jgi:glycosyltransferase involved in cell wall biosynthesis
MRVLMLGWEFPPYFAGGVGVACHALTKALARRDVDITYVMPEGPEQADAAHLRLLVASRLAPHVTVARVPGEMLPYASFAYPTHSTTAWAANSPTTKPLYGSDLAYEIERFAARVGDLVARLPLSFDVIHAHDWTTFPAGIALRRATGKPLVVHVHITEFDKSGGSHADPRTWAIEHAGMAAADLVIAVSERTRRRCIEQYGIDEAKIVVVHNGIEPGAPRTPDAGGRGREATRRDKVVLFLGRVTLQKGPDLFVEAARRVLAAIPDVTFVLAGAGDMLPRVIERSAELGLGPRMLFAGFVDREQAAELYRRADLFVMPSVSEPFGLVPLEAMDRGVPVIVSRQSGVSEVLRHAIKVDAWNVEELAAKMIAALAYPALRRELRANGSREVQRLDWSHVAEKVRAVYERLVPSFAHA